MCSTDALSQFSYTDNTPQVFIRNYNGFGAKVITENNAKSSVSSVLGKSSLLLVSLAPTFSLVLMLFWGRELGGFFKR